MKKQISSEFPLLFYMMISLFCMNLFSRGSVVCFIFAVLSVGAMALQYRKLRIDGTTLLVLLFSIVSFLVAGIYFDFVEAIKCLNYVLLYIIGLNGYKISNDKEAFVKRSVFAIFAGFAIYVLLTFYTNLNKPQIEGQRLIVDFWKQDYVSVTMVGLLSSVVIGYFFYTLMLRRHVLLKLVALFTVVIALTVNVQTATRTPLILFAIMAVLMVCIYLFDQRGEKAFKVLVAIVFLVCVLVCVYTFDIFNVRSYLESTPLFARFLREGASTGRTEIMKLYFSKALDFPWGGGHIEETTGYTAHNYIQQCYDLYGVFATIPLLFITVGFFKNTVALIGTHSKSDIDYLFISMYITMLIQALMEPVYTGYPCFMFSVFLIHGIASAYLRDRNNEVQ